MRDEARDDDHDDRETFETETMLISVSNSAVYKIAKIYISTWKLDEQGM